MPKAFKRCVKAGGRVRTIKPKAGRYQHVCVRPGGKKGPRGGRTVAGHVKKTKR